MANVKIPAVISGLALAWGGTALLLSPAGAALGDTASLTVLWVLACGVVAIVLLWEKRPLSSLGLRRFRWRSAGWGLLLAITLFYGVIPVLTVALREAGIPGFEAGMSAALATPAWFRLCGVLTAGIVEDTIFLAFPVTRLREWTGNPWFAGALSVSVFALLHWPNWGLGPVLIYLVTGAISTAFFWWRRDLLANMVAHATVDALALLIIPAISGHMR